LKIELFLNGESRTVEARANITLNVLLHDYLGITSCKTACGTGECGACTVLLDGKPVASCLVLAPQANGRKVTTLEGLITDSELNTVQKLFVDLDALQCGYCIPGMILTAYALIKEKKYLSHREAVRALTGNLCRCTGYVRQIEAVKLASRLALLGE
jgi:carbon-monoxide dehydrogenase small subunit